MKSHLLVLLTISLTVGLMSFNHLVEERTTTPVTDVDKLVQISDELQTAVYVRHQVEDFKSWKAVFDEHEPMRREAGISLLALAKDLQDDQTLHIAFSTESHESAKAFAASEELKGAMEKAGVVGEPSIRYLDIVSAGEAELETNTRLLVIHEVEDWDRWKEAYDDHAEMRAEAGFIERVISPDADNPNVVLVSQAVTNMEKAKEFAKSDELKEAMQEAGVVGEPEMYWFDLMEEKK